MREDSGYILTLLREDADFTLYRGTEQGSLTPVLIVAAGADRPSLQSLRRIEHEWSLAADLDLEWAARPISLTRHHGGVALVLEDPGGEPLDRIIQQQGGSSLDLSRCLRIAVGLTKAVSQVHRQGLVHRDVKPANAFVDHAGRAWLTGFGIASRIPRERLLPASEVIAGSLAYMSPEQTGRMNRSVDSRSDLYSLGVTLYELFTGRLPFIGSDPMEWVHCHIARSPAVPEALAPEVPAAVSSVIMKLLAKTADDRYQTAAAVEHDLRRCLVEWESHGQIATFHLGEHDIPDWLLIPEKLYGREAAIETLLASFGRVVMGAGVELVLVSGDPGVGKSAVVNELHKPLVPSRGFFASGKFDQYKRDIPYATLAQAFQSLIRSILATSEGELARWRDAIGEALGDNAQLMIDLVPELKLIIGEQKPISELPARDAQTRFQLAFRRLVGVFTRERPLALFLDDLQWLDTATLDLVENLLTQHDVKRLMLIGAYRDNEVSPTHPLRHKLKAMSEVGANIREIALAPLTRNDLEGLLADSLFCGREHVAPLAALVQEKTNGNPFFAIQFIHALFDEGLLDFNHNDGRWCWDLGQIRAKGYTDNVVELMVGRLSQLPADARKALQQFACLGNSAEFATLELVYQDSIDAIHRHLWEAVRAGLVLRAEDSYRFVHDRVLEAAYSLIPLQRRAEAHRQIGTLIASHTSPEDLEERVFEIVNQLNRGAHLMTSTDERENVARLNLIAARRAKTSTAYASAIRYLEAGRQLLTEATWDRNPELIFAIDSVLGECEVLTGDLTAAESRLSTLTRQAKTAHDIAFLTRLRLTLYNLLDRSDSGVDVFIEYQAARGETWSAHPSGDEVSREFERIWTLMGTRRFEELIDLPLITDPDLLDVLDVLTEAVLTAQFTDENLHALVLCRIVGLSLVHGNSDASSFAFVTLGMIAGLQFGNYDAGFQLGKLGFDLVEKHRFRRYQARVYMRFGNLVMPWSRHVKSGRELIRRAFDAANDAGDLTFAAYSCTNLYNNLLVAGDRLPEVLQGAEFGLAFAEKLRFGRATDMITTQIMFVRNLCGLTNEFGSFDDGDFKELAFERHLSSNKTLARPECWYWIRKLQALFFAGDFASAIKASAHARHLFALSHSYFEVIEYYFYGALVHARAMDSTDDSVRMSHMEIVAHHRGRLAAWAQNCPENFENCVALVDAEIARIEGRFLEAEHAYEQAIRSAQANGFLQNEAIANELAAYFYAARGFDKTARAYLRDARSGYLNWGAIGKVKQLDRSFPYIKDEYATASPANSIMGSTSLLDLTTVVKLSQALSSEIVLPRLVEKLVRLAVENAGASRGLLILLRGNLTGGEPRIEAEAVSDASGINVVVKQAAITPAVLSQPVLDYVIRTKERVLLGDASADVEHSNTGYVRQYRTRSLLCLPIVKQATLVGVLYLENNLAPRVFTSERVELLQLLASQAAISLENATLYGELQRSEAFLAVGQRISHTGSFGWSASSGEHYWSEEGYNIIEYDRHVRPSVDLVLQRVHPDDRDFVRRALDAAISEKKDFDSEHRFLMPDGRIKHIHATGRALNTGNLEFVGAVRDITERKRAEESLRQAMTDLARINRATTMGELAASLAHEVNQPITGAVAYASACLRWLDREQPNLEEARAAAASMGRDGRRAAEIIARVRKQFEKGALNREAFDVGEIIQETVGLLRGEVARYGISVRTELATDLPAVIGDRVQLQQVAMNLIVNGMEAMKDVDGERALVVTTGRTADGHILVSISDTGTGVPPQIAEQIFDPFFTTKPHGTGMGLRISRSIVESHGGHLSVVDGDGPGSTFQFTLPSLRLNGE